MTADATDNDVVFPFDAMVVSMSIGTPLANFARTKTQSSESGSVVEVMVHPLDEMQPVMSVQDAGALKREMDDARRKTSGREYSSGSTKSKRDRGATWFLWMNRRRKCECALIST